MTSAVRAWGSLGVLMVAYTVSFVDRTILSLLIPPIQKDLGLTDTSVSLLVGMAFAVFYTFMGIPLGRLADRYNRRNLIAAGIFLWCLMTAACGLARNFWQLFLARVGVGVGEAALSPAAYSLISDLFPKEHLGRAIAVYSFGLPVGSGLALLIGGYAIAEIAALPPVVVPGFGTLSAWQLTFVMVGLPGLLVGLMVMGLTEPARRDRLTRTPGTVGEPASTGLLAFLGANRHLLLLQFAGLSLLVIIVYGCTAWIPTFFIRVHDWTATDIGYAYGVIFLLFGTSGLYTGGVLADRWWRAGRTDAHLRVVICSVATMTPCFALIPAVGSPQAALALLALATFTSSLHGGVAGAALQLITPNELRGQMTAIYFFIANLVGLGLGPSVVALLTDYAFGDPKALGWSFATLSLIAGPLSVLLITAALGHYRHGVARIARLGGPIDNDPNGQ
ncbi:MAG: spinster family MFS transporter [Pseudomonadales bacterium]